MPLSPYYMPNLFKEFQFLNREIYYNEVIPAAELLNTLPRERSLTIPQMIYYAFFKAKPKFKVGDIVYVNKSAASFNWRLNKHLGSPFVVVDVPNGSVKSDVLYDIREIGAGDDSLKPISVLEEFLADKCEATSSES